MDAPRGGAGVWTVLMPRWQAMLSGLRKERSFSEANFLLLAVVGLAFWTAVFGIAERVLRYIRGVEEIGNLLAGKLLGILLLAFLAILLLSNVITALSSFFLAKDLDLLVAAPVTRTRFYLAKLIETAIHSSWMVALLSLPIFTAYGVVYDGGFLFPAVVAAAVIPLMLLPAVAGSAVTLMLVNIFPARRTRDLLSLVAVGAVGIVVLLLRFIRPEQLARPDGFRDLVEYLAVLRTPTSPLLPSEWAAEMIMNWLLRVADPDPILLLWGAAAIVVGVGALLHGKFYHLGFTKAQEGGRRVVRRRLRGPLDRLLAPLAPARREFIIKDLRVFFRDNTQWSQLILLAVLLLVYLFNIRSLPLFSGERVPFAVVTLVVFLNIGLAGFVLAAVAARFVFPAVSLEGRQLWLIRSAPVDSRALLWSKYWIGTLPLLALAVTIMVVTNVLLRASPFMMVVSLGTIVLYTMAASALALAFGAFYPQFGTENAAQIPTSFGGLVYMMTSLTLLGAVIALEAIPITAYLRAVHWGRTPEVTPQMLAAGAGVVVLCLLATALPLRLSARQLDAIER